MMAKVIGWVFWLGGIGLFLFAIVYAVGFFFFGFSPIAGDTAFTTGRLVYFGVAGIVGSAFGATLLTRARTEDVDRISEEIAEVAKEKESEWMRETNGAVPLRDWLVRKGYLDKYKSVIDLGS